MILWIYSLCQGHVGMFGTTNPPIPSPFPFLNLGHTWWVWKAGMALGGSSVTLHQLCPSQIPSGAELQEFPWRVAGLGHGGLTQLLTSCCHSGIAI